MSFSSQMPWLKFYGETPAQLTYPSGTVYQLVRETAVRYPDSIAYEFLGKKTTYARFLLRIEEAAKGFLALGVKRGDRVTICLPNCPQAVDSFYALSRIGAVANFLHPLSAPGEIRHALELSRSRFLLTLDQFYERTVSATQEPMTIVTARLRDELPFPSALLYPLKQKAALPRKGAFLLWKDFLKAGHWLQLPSDDGSAEDPCAILYSGGTTGTTKGIVLSSMNFNALALQTIAACGFAPIHGLRMLSLMPLFHGFGLGIGIHTALVGGSCCLLVPRFDSKLYARLLIKKRPHMLPGVPSLFEALLRSEDLCHADLSFLKGVFCGGDSMPPERKQAVDAFLREHGAKVQLRQGYGLTECVTASCLTPKDLHREGSIGIPFPDTCYTVCRPGTTEELPPDTEGELCLTGPTVMVGYLEQEQETAAVLRRHSDCRLWLHTGDLGKMDQDGFLYFTGRLKRMIVTSGYNVYPCQLERILEQHEAVLLSCVIGVPDPYKIQAVKAFVVLKDGISPTDALRQELLAHCSAHIAKYAMPRELEFRSELPKTPVGKVAYRQLEEEERKKR